MEVDATGDLQHPVQFDQPHSHHHKVGHHVVVPQKRRHRLQKVCQLPGTTLNHVLIDAGAFQRPVPSIVKCPDLGRRLLTAFLFEQHVVAGVRIEGRVQIN